MAALDALDASKVFYWNTSFLVPAAAWPSEQDEHNTLPSLAVTELGGITVGHRAKPKQKPTTPKCSEARYRCPRFLVVPPSKAKAAHTDL